MTFIFLVLVTIAGTELTTPNYPSNYPNNEDSGHIIRFEEKQRITLTFLEFNLEKGYNSTHGSSCR